MNLKLSSIRRDWTSNKMYNFQYALDNFLIPNWGTVVVFKIFNYSGIKSCSIAIRHTIRTDRVLGKTKNWIWVCYFKLSRSIEGNVDDSNYFRICAQLFHLWSSNFTETLNQKTPSFSTQFQSKFEII
jgi:hypothetical protein